MEFSGAMYSSRVWTGYRQYQIFPAVRLVACLRPRLYWENLHECSKHCSALVRLAAATLGQDLPMSAFEFDRTRTYSECEPNLPLIHPIYPSPTLNSVGSPSIQVDSHPTKKPWIVQPTIMHLIWLIEKI